MGKVKAIVTPQNQKRLTNIAIVKYKSHGKRFEIACAKNKVLDWREGVETILDEVLQTTTIFENVGKGKMAATKDVQTVFGDKSEEDICKFILENGELQVSEKERDVQLSELFRQVATVIAEKCVSPQTGLPLTRTMVESLMKECHISIRPGIPAKKQALKVMEVLCVHDGGVHIARADMKLRIAVPEQHVAKARDLLKTVISDSTAIDETTSGKTLSFVFECAPSHYRSLDVFVQEHSGNLLVLDRAVTGEGAARNIVNDAPAESSTRPEKPSSGYAMSGTTVGKHLAGKGKGKGKAKAAPFCSTCSYQSESAADYREHCKSDWHTYNLKRKVKGMPPVTIEEMQEEQLDKMEFLAVDA